MEREGSVDVTVLCAAPWAVGVEAVLFVTGSALVLVLGPVVSVAGLRAAVVVVVTTVVFLAGALELETEVAVEERLVVDLELNVELVELSLTRLGFVRPTFAWLLGARAECLAVVVCCSGRRT